MRIGGMGQSVIIRPQNTFCLALDRIRDERNDDEQEQVAGRYWSDLKPEQLPPCRAESGGFMSDREWAAYCDIP